MIVGVEEVMVEKVGGVVASDCRGGGGDGGEGGWCSS